MNFFDAHCDTIFEIIEKNEKLFRNSLQVDLERIRKYDAYTQVFAAWLENSDNAWQQFLKMADKFHAEMEQNTEQVMHCKTYTDLKNAHEQNKCAAFFAVEGAYMVEHIEHIDRLYQQDVRFVTLTWNGANSLAGGVESDLGLSSLGTDVVQRMEELGMVVDVSHLNERSFWDVVKTANKPFVATHSNSYAVCPHKRNLTDEQFLALCRAGGCAGINFYTVFLNGSDKAEAGDLLAHIKHFMKLGGENHIGLGSDFDGVSSLPAGIRGAEDMQFITNLLEREGFSGGQIDKITHLNFERIVKEVM